MKPFYRPQKEKELLLFNRFIDLININALKISQPEPPEPDIVFLIDDKIIGVEITELYSDNYLEGKGSKLREQQSLRNKVIELAVAKIDKRIDWYFELFVSFSYSINPTSVHSLSNSITNILNNQLIDITPKEEYQIIEFNNSDYNLNLEKLSIIISNTYDQHYFGSTEAGFTPHLKIENIVKAITEKDNKIAGYRSSNNDEVWLLLAEMGSIASTFDNIKDALSNKYDSKFDRIFLLRSLYKKVVEIKSLHNKKIT